MAKYTLNGETIDVEPKDEKQFKIDNPKAEKVISNFGSNFSDFFKKNEEELKDTTLEKESTDQLESEK